MSSGDTAPKQADGATSDVASTPDATHLLSANMIVSLDPALNKNLNSRSPVALNWLVDFQHRVGLPEKPADVIFCLDRDSRLANDAIFHEAFSGFDPYDPKNEALLQEAMASRIEEVGQQVYSERYYESQAQHHRVHLKAAIDACDAHLVAFHAVQMATSRALMLYQRHAAGAVWRANQLGRSLHDLLSLWEAERGNGEEEFWQKKFSENTIALSQLFAYPVVVLKEKAYLGGKGVDNRNGSVLDYLFTNDLTGNAGLVEIKTPMTPLLANTEYRGGVFAPSTELSGAIAQVMKYGDDLSKDFFSLHYRSQASLPQDKVLEAFDPPALVIAGDAERELTIPHKKRSFELYRHGLAKVRLVTFDEVFAKIKTLIKLLEQDVQAEAAKPAAP